MTRLLTLFLAVFCAVSHGQTQTTRDLAFLGSVTPAAGGTLFLDTYSTNTSSAYATILLRTAYTGPLVRIRESGGNTEKDFYQGATVGSLNATRGGGGQDALTFCAGVNGLLPRIYAQDTNGSPTLDMVQATAGSQPVIISGGAYVALQNSIPGIGFTNAFMTVTNANAYAAPANYHVFTVAKQTAAIAYMGIFHPDNMTTGWGLLEKGAGGQLGIERANAAKFQTTALVNGTIYLFDASYDGTDHLFKNGSADEQAVTDSGYGTNPAAFGTGYNNNTAQGWNGLVWCVITFSKALGNNAAGARTALDNIYTGIP
jgi:hypothetical protein